MLIYKNISLKKYNTFGLDYNADCMIRISTIKDAVLLFRGGFFWKKPLLILGDGSNILFTNDFKGTILRPEFRGIRIEENTGDSVLISAGAGVKWDTLVEWCVKNGYGGLENLSHIPGTAGASPVQNIGAYGVEIGNFIEKVKAISVEDGTIVEFNKTDCNFGYRSSIFKKDFKGKYLIIKVYYRLNTSPLLKLDYGYLHDETSKLGELSIKNVRTAVINIRRSKLPDPEIIGNAGSFFKNPVISKTVAENLGKMYPLIPLFEDPSGGKKLAAAWMIDQCGWKGKRLGNAGVHEKQALVLINHGNAAGKDIFALSELIKRSVLERFGIELEREVEVVGVI